jgi:hypothetical protein
VREKLVKWVNVGDCVMENQTYTARERGQEGYPRAFLARPQQWVVIACTTGGPLTDYFRFASRTAMVRALADYPGVRHRQVCVLDHEMFDGAFLYDPAAGRPLDLAAMCRRLNGAVLPPVPTKSSSVEQCRSAERAIKKRLPHATGINCATVPLTTSVP